MLISSLRSPSAYQDSSRVEETRDVHVVVMSQGVRDNKTIRAIQHLQGVDAIVGRLGVPPLGQVADSVLDLIRGDGDAVASIAVLLGSMSLVSGDTFTEM